MLTWPRPSVHSVKRTRGSLSRPACRHVKQGAKRPGFLVKSAFCRRGAPRAPQGRPKLSDDEKKLRPATQLVHGGGLRSQFGETSEAMFLTQGFAYDDDGGGGGALQRRRIRASSIRGSRIRPSRCSSSALPARGRPGGPRDGERHGRGDRHAAGAGRAGDHVVSARALFGSCRLRGGGSAAAIRRRLDLVDGVVFRNGKRRSGQTKVFFLESPTNPGLEIYDIAPSPKSPMGRGPARRRQRLRHSLLQKPFELGADVVVYSATKHIDGQGRCLGGVFWRRRR